MVTYAINVMQEVSFGPVESLSKVSSFGCFSIPLMVGFIVLANAHRILVFIGCGYAIVIADCYILNLILLVEKLMLMGYV